jgi:antitoxin ParD1/3/4
MSADNGPSTSMNVSLPQSLRTFVEKRVAASAYTSASEYVRELIRQDRERQGARDRLEELLLDGLASGPAKEMTASDWAALRKRVTKRIAAKKPSKSTKR